MISNQNLITGAYAVQGANGSVGLNSIVSCGSSYNYKQKYFLQGSIRRDGISKLSPDTRWNNFDILQDGILQMRALCLESEIMF
jgi:hypothetical protein